MEAKEDMLASVQYFLSVQAECRRLNNSEGKTGRDNRKAARWQSERGRRGEINMAVLVAACHLAGEQQLYVSLFAHLSACITKRAECGTLPGSAPSSHPRMLALVM